MDWRKTRPWGHGTVSGTVKRGSSTLFRFMVDPGFTSLHSGSKGFTENRSIRSRDETGPRGELEKGREKI